MALRHLRTYRAIQLIRRHGSIRKAAEILAISPSALNRSILALEDELGVEIFDRLPGGVEPSVAGELLFRHLDEHLSCMDDFVSLIAEMRGGAAGSLRLAVSADLTDGLLPAVLRRFRDSHPAIALEVLESEDGTPLQRREADLSLTTRPTREPIGTEVASLAARVIGRVAAGHPRAGQALTLSQIADHALILPPAGTGLRQALDRALGRSRIEPRARHVLPRGPILLAEGPVPDLQPVLDPGAQDGGRVDLSALRMAPVTIRVHRRPAGHLPRAADLFLAMLQREGSAV